MVCALAVFSGWHVVDLKKYSFVGVGVPEHSKETLFFSKNA